MKISRDKLRALAADRGLTVSALLSRARVSRTAYYSLARRPSVLPGSLRALAHALGVPAIVLLEETPPPLPEAVQRRLGEARAICDAEPAAAFENVWHTLCLLDMPPIERLNRSLIRGRAATLHG